MHAQLPSKEDLPSWPDRVAIFSGDSLLNVCASELSMLWESLKDTLPPKLCYIWKVKDDIFLQYGRTGSVVWDSQL
jgi:hypothetical protein